MQRKTGRKNDMLGWLAAVVLLASFAGWLWQFKAMIRAVLGW